MFGPRSSYRAAAAEVFLGGGRRSTLGDSRLYYRKGERGGLAGSTTAGAETAEHTVGTQLSRDQKASISDQLNDALLRLRALNVPDSVSLGGVDGEGCKDTRRHTRICQESVRTCAAFEDFKFSNPHFGSSAYISLLRGLSSSHTAKVVFSHGDLRPENIVVQPDQHGNYFLTGILDWEKSGFYPDYFECTKATSNMSPSDADDWYLYLPRCASPTTYPLMWLVDRVWDIHIA